MSFVSFNKIAYFFILELILAVVTLISGSFLVEILSQNKHFVWSNASLHRLVLTGELVFLFAFF